MWNGVTDVLWYSMPLKRKCFLSITVETLLVPVEMNGIELPEETSFHLLGLTCTRTMNWKPRLLWGNWAPFIGPSISLLLNSSCIRTNLPFSHVWSTVPISGVELKGPMDWSTRSSAETGSQLSRLSPFFWFAIPVTQEGCC